MPFCYCCLSTAEKVNIVMSNFGPLNRLNQIETSEFPQFLCGRILPVESFLNGPVSGKECVYYEAVVERLEDKTDDNGLIGVPDAEDSLKVWVPVYFERKSADFVLMDPAFPSASLYVPGSVIPVQVLATEDTSVKAASNLLHKKAKVTVQQGTLSPNIEEFLKRGAVDLHTESKKEKEKEKTDKKEKVVYRYRESSFEKGEQVAVLGIVQRVTDDKGAPVDVVKTMSQENLTDAFFERKGFSDWDRRSWLDLTEQPCAIITDMPKYFQGLQIPAIPTQLPHAKPINIADLKSNTMQR